MTDTETGALDAPESSDQAHDSSYDQPADASADAPADAAQRSDHVLMSLDDLEALIGKRVDEALAARPHTIAPEMDPQRPMEHRLVVVTDHGRQPIRNEVLKDATFDQAVDRIHQLFDDPDAQVTHVEHIPEVGSNVTYIHPDLLPKR